MFGSIAVSSFANLLVLGPRDLTPMLASSSNASSSIAAMKHFVHHLQEEAKRKTSNVAMRPRISIIKLYFSGRFRSIVLLIERAVCIMGLLLDCRTEFQEIIWYRLIGSFQDVNQGAGLSLVVLCEQSDSRSLLTGSSSPRSC